MTVGELRRALFEYDDNALVAVTDGWNIGDLKYIGEPSIFMVDVTDVFGDNVKHTLVISLKE